jgi:murein DD-endopeptidase MepM/ murein hydrolase activator NlpD
MLRVVGSRRLRLYATICVLASTLQVSPTTQRQALDKVEVRVGAGPVPVEGTDGRTHIGYELHVTVPADSGDLQLERLEVFGEREVEPLVSYGAVELEGRVRPDAESRARDGRVVRRNTTAVVNVWVTVPPGRGTPSFLRNELRASGTGRATVIGSLRVNVRAKAALVLGPPLRGGLWIAHNGPGDHLAAHWGSVLVKGRRITVPQRFAIDFIGIDANGRGVRSQLEGSSNADWVGFGAEVIAVADGVIREARDGILDNPPLFEPGPPVSTELSAAGGNYVVLQLGDKTLVHYAHLRQGSLAVRTGERVRQGQLIGRVGNSGNTNGAHLHFNVVDEALVSNAEGLPYVFDSFEILGTTTGDAAFGDAAPPPGSPAQVRRALPLNGTIVRFGGY